MWVDFDVRDNKRWTFSLEEALKWITDSYFSQKWQFKVKSVLMLDLFQLLSSQDVNWWTGVVWITCGLLWCFYQLFGLSFWRHPFTAEDPMLSDVMLHFSKSDEETNSSTSWMAWGGVHFQHIYYSFVWTLEHKMFAPITMSKSSSDAC